MNNSTPPEFITWLNAKMDERGWSIRQTAKHAGISHSSISLIINGDIPSFATCAALAAAFNFPPLEVFKLAGLISDRSADNIVNAELLHLLGDLPLDEQIEILEIVRIKSKKTKENPIDRSSGTAALSNV